MPETIFDKFEEAMYEFIFYEKLNLIRLRKPKVDENDRSEIIHNFPSKEGIIIKTIFELNENGRKFPNKTFYNYNPATFDYAVENIDKKSITKLLKEHLIDYIKKNNSLSDNFNLIEKKIIKKNNAVNYDLKFSEYITFSLQLEPSDLNVPDVSSLILSLPIEQTKEFKDSKQQTEVGNSNVWKVELAKSSRAACRTCGEKITKDTIRIGEPSFFDEHLSYKWYHFDCIKHFKDNITLDGLETLEIDQQEIIKNKLHPPKLEKQPTNDQEAGQIPEEFIVSLIDKYQDSEGLAAESDIYAKARNEGLSDDKIKEILTKMEEEGKLYRPANSKLKLI